MHGGGVDMRMSGMDVRYFMNGDQERMPPLVAAFFGANAVLMIPLGASHYLHTTNPYFMSALEQGVDLND